MKTLERLFRKRKKIVVGLMSGTSADGMDAALVEITGSGTATRVRQLAFRTYPYPAGFKPYLLRHSDRATARIEDITLLNMLIAEFSADAVRRIARAGGKRLAEIDLIGSHGQTIHHLPRRERRFGKLIRATLQIGSPSAIAKKTGVVTVGDFRTGDVAAGGSGAPLVPLFDYLILRSTRRSRGILNIGGIANLTVLPKRCSPDQVLAFDTGPGNMVIDALTEKFYGRAFDRNGAVALKGRILPGLIQKMLRDPYFRLAPPKSTGRETFGASFVRSIAAASRRARKEDVIATVTEFTALSIYQQYLAFVSKTTPIDELYVGGGGVHNPYLMTALQHYFGPIPVRPTDDVRVSADAKEAVCFALLANETIAGNPANVPGATGASRRTILGVIALP